MRYIRLILIVGMFLWQYNFIQDRNTDANVFGDVKSNVEHIHFAGAPEQQVDEYVTTMPFTELGMKVGYTFVFESIDSGIEVRTGTATIFTDLRHPGRFS